MLTVFQKIFKLQKGSSEIQFWTLLGPFFILLSVICAFTYSHNNFDLCFIAVLGLVLCWKFQTKGLLFSYFGHVLIIALKHTQLDGNHLWQFGLEISFALGFLITAFSLEYASTFVKILEKKIENFLGEVQMLEKKLEKKEQLQNHLQNEHRVKYSQLQAELEETYTEISSMQTLADVLRKNANQNLDRKKSLLTELVKKERKLVQKEIALQEIQEKILSLKDVDALYERNKKLLNKLNGARVSKYQTQLINETLVRLLARQKQQNSDLMSKTQVQSLEKNTLVEQLFASQREIESLCTNIQKLSLELDAARKNLKDAKQVQDLHSLSYKEKSEEKNRLLRNSEEKMEQYRQLQASFKQLKKQFEEKKEIIHETRSELFHLDVKHQAIQRDLEEERVADSHDDRVLMQHIDEADALLKEYENENNELMELVTLLSNRLEENKPEKRKLKAVEQSFSFMEEGSKILSKEKESGSRKSSQ